MLTVNDTSTARRCSRCKQWKNNDDFGLRSREQGYQSWCIRCAQDYKRNPNEPSIDPFESLVLDELKRNGIYAVKGKRVSGDFSDIIAWGCIKLEVKSSILHANRQFVFKFTARQQAQESECDFVVLVCRWEDRTTLHVLPATDPSLFIGWNRKAAVVYQPLVAHRKVSRSATPLTSEKMSQAQNRWELIEERRKEVSEAIKQYP